MITVLIVILHIIVALTLVLVVLLQVGKGGSIGAAFGGGGLITNVIWQPRAGDVSLTPDHRCCGHLYVNVAESSLFSSHNRQRSSITDQMPATESAPPAPTPAPTSPPASEGVAPENPPASEAPATESTPAPTQPSQEPKTGQQ